MVRLHLSIEIPLITTLPSLCPSCATIIEGFLPGFIVTGNNVNLFMCQPPNTFQCGTGHGPGDCTQTFPFSAPTIVLRDSQVPGAVNQVNYTNPSLSFIEKSSVAPVASNNNNSTVSTVCTQKNGTSESTNNNRKSNELAVGLGVGLPMLAMLLAALGAVYVQQMRLQGQRKEQLKIRDEEIAKMMARKRHVENASGTTEERMTRPMERVPRERPRLRSAESEQRREVYELESPVQARERSMV
ncbi:uncharacterized protein KY384_000161 [Bacidia gigantensis]|uniref:uncharacterized protein n=1 Tax=Bacidia gigantensis TaxID=2732470 RepID=UPI001D03DAEE|nr:uncharacterized protein KY384_000161 [Bacidia gigantensis]KAG8526168.1 hypothetical protein KY384_000161 [Bacidia gigantensis]